MASGDLSASRSEREREASEREAVEHVRKRAREARMEIIRQCPPGYALDQVHAMVLLADLGGTNPSRLLQRTFLVRQEIAAGWSRAGVAASFNMDSAELERQLVREIWWRPTRAMLEQYPVEVRLALGELGVQPAD